MYSIFKEMNKSDFKEIKKRYRNQNTITKKSDRVFKKCFTFIKTSLLKK